jgi:hypothetical protein
MVPPGPDHVQEAIRDCVARCRTHAQPLTCIAEAIGELRADPNWTDAEVTQVEMAVRRIIARLIDPQ